MCSRRRAARARAVEPRQVAAGDADRAAVGNLEPGEQVQQRRLARAGGAGDRVQPAAVNERSRPVEDRRRAVALRQPLRPRRRPARAAPRPPPPRAPARHPAARSPARRDDDRAVLEAGDGLRRDPRAQQKLLGQPQPAAAADDDRVALVAVTRPLLGDAPVSDAHDPVGDPRRLRVVADDHGRAAMLPHELREHVVHLVGGRAVELAGRLVGEEDLRPVSEGGAERDALLLAARELGRMARALLCEADPLEQLVGPPQALARRGAAQAELQGDELARAQLGCERTRIVLIRVAEECRAVRRQAPRGQLAEVLAVHAHDAGRRTFEARQQPQQRRLAGAARAEHRQYLALRDASVTTPAALRRHPRASSGHGTRPSARSRSCRCLRGAGR